LTTLGIGATKVDLVLPKGRFAQGESLEGRLKLEGGMLDQKIEKIYLRLYLNSSFKRGDNVQYINREMASAIIAEGFNAAAKSRYDEIPIRFDIPAGIPVSTSSTRYYLLTGLDIASAVDPKDTDGIEIIPGGRQGVAMQAIEKVLGFHRKPRTGEFNGRYQEFEYRPTNFMRGKLDELEVVYGAASGGIKLFMQIDKRARGLLGMIAEEWDLDERNVSLFVPDSALSSPNAAANFISEFIDNEFRRIF